MTRCLDIVNFNADASCLTSSRWLQLLQGGKDSLFCQWLKIYIDLKKKVVLGLPGAVLADLHYMNIEAIELLNLHHDIFQTINRPFTHDAALLRSSIGYAINLEYGLLAQKQATRHHSECFLPPEFMCTAPQASTLKSAGIPAIFIHPTRFDFGLQKFIPTEPYKIKATFGETLNCIPFDGMATEAYLNSIHNYSAVQWNKHLLKTGHHDIYTWRDGESIFLLPESIEREYAWLNAETTEIDRDHLKSADHTAISDNVFSYPIHSFTAWIKEMRMYGFLQGIAKVEERLPELSALEKHLWLLLISSDVLSAVEKESPRVSIRTNFNSAPQTILLQRADKGWEGQELLEIFHRFSETRTQQYLCKSDEPHIVKTRARLKYLELLEGSRETAN